MSATLNVTVEVDDPIYEMRQLASAKMGSPFYRGEHWFISLAMRWLPYMLGSVCVENCRGIWRVRSMAYSDDFVQGETLEKALLEAVLSTDPPDPM